MSYATGTTHYNLPQTVGTDKRDWFDTNQAFSDIDAAIYGAVQTAETAEADLTSVTTRVGTLETDVASLETTTDTHSSNISALQTNVTQMGNAITDNKQDVLDMIESTQEASATAAYAHAVGSYFIYNDTLYVTTVAIAVGDTIVPNTNCETTDIGTVLAQLNSDLNTLDSYVKASTFEVGVDITSYNSSSNPYVAPSDGYLFLQVHSASGNSAIADIDGAGTDFNATLRFCADYTIGDNLLFIRKGMKIVTNTIHGTAKILFTPFTS